MHPSMGIRSMDPEQYPLCKPPAENIVAKNDLCYALRICIPVNRGHLPVTLFRYTPDFSR